MASLRWLAVLVPSVLGLSIGVATAQGRGAPSGVQLVSPGGVQKATITTTCPSFSWAPIDGVAEYELGVFEVNQTLELQPTPVIHAVVPGRASAWTPPATACLRPGGNFMWFMREVRRKGDTPAEWSAGLAFSVIDDRTALATAAASRGEIAGGSSAAACRPQDPGCAKGGGNGNPNDAILGVLDDISTKLDQLLNPNPFSRQFCIAVGPELELSVEGQVRIAGGADGSIGAKAFANGIKAGLAAAGEAKFGGALKGAGEVKWSWCWDRTPPSTTQAALTSQRSAIALAAPATVSDDVFIARVMALADQLQINDDRLTAMLDAVPAFAGGIDPWSSLRSNGALTNLADVLPLPESLRTTMRDPGQIIASFRAQLDLCAQNNLPPAVADVVGEFCTLASGERFSKLLDRVDGVVQNVKGSVDNVKSTVNSVQSTVTNIKSRVDDVYCVFFCQ